jgi:hypothetical protein
MAPTREPVGIGQDRPHTSRDPDVRTEDRDAEAAQIAIET